MLPADVFPLQGQSLYYLGPQCDMNLKIALTQSNGPTLFLTHQMHVPK